MQKVIWLLMVMFLAIPATAQKVDESKVHAIAQGMDDPTLMNLAKKTDTALASIISHAVSTLHDQGFDRQAEEINMQFKSSYRGYVTMMVSQRHIGDFAPLLQWMTTTYNSIEAALGVQTCKALHLSDLKTLNYCIPVCFKPCTFALSGRFDRRTEYRLHFAMDNGGVGDPENSLYGLSSVIVYWVIDVGCLSATSGLASCLCGIAASGGEYFMGNLIAPPIANKIFDAACPSHVK